MKRHSKNEPTLYDNLMANHSEESIRRYEKQIGPNHMTAFRFFRMAQRFVFDHDASFMLGELIKKAGPLILREHEFARPPFDLTWVEIDFRAYVAGIGRSQVEIDDPTGDTRVGYYFNRNILMCVSETATTKPIMSPVWYRMHEPVSFEEELERAQYFGLSRMVYRMTTIGDSGLDNIWWDSPEGQSFCRSHRVMPAAIMDGLSTEQRRAILNGGAGTLKQGIAILLLLTRPGRHVIALADQEHRHGIIRGKSKVLVAHRKVTLHLSVPKSVKKVIEALHTGEHRRYHAVRGHWCQTRRGPSCDHEWQPVDPDRYECMVPGCKAKRWWKREHHRGSIEEGTVTKGYEVTK